ncbi:hypothetical protein VE25_16515 [Devosia geojensis]|uniref:Uncharacterized protein n=1 Tax=Devosia geojensis TaxID=443610 RepID=A0A0F5FPF6_9HYPH|nr:hypothetical protein [Devosia geojensis]KKB10726.1 hypothetical protein VE25_16515 [Devosia geojensis]
MNLPDRHLLLGMTLGAICATALTAIGPGLTVDVFADEARPAIDTDALVRIGERDYRITHADWVSTTPISNSRIRKIEYGRSSYVDVAVTETGTYSTDGFASPHVLYPGIEVEEVSSREPFAIALLGGWGHWVVTPLVKGSSLLHLRTAPGERIISDGSTTCLLSRDYSIC